MSNIGFDVSDVGDAAKGLVNTAVGAVTDPAKFFQKAAGMSYQDIIVFTSQAPLLKDTPLATFVKDAQGPLADPILGPLLACIILLPNPTFAFALNKMARGESLMAATLKSFSEVLKMGIKILSAGTADVSLPTDQLLASLPPDTMSKLTDMLQQYGDQLKAITSDLDNLQALGLPGIPDLDFKQLADKAATTQFAAAAGLMNKIGTQVAQDDFNALKFDGNGVETTGQPFGYRLAPTIDDLALRDKSTGSTSRWLATGNNRNLPQGTMRAAHAADINFLRGYDIALGMKADGVDPATFQHIRLTMLVGPERQGFDTATVTWDGAAKMATAIQATKSNKYTGSAARQISKFLPPPILPKLVRNPLTAARSNAGAALIFGMAGAPQSVKDNAAKAAVIDPAVKAGATAALKQSPGWFGKLLAYFGF